MVSRARVEYNVPKTRPLTKDELLERAYYYQKLGQKALSDGGGLCGFGSSPEGIQEARYWFSRSRYFGRLAVNGKTI